MEFLWLEHSLLQCITSQLKSTTTRISLSHYLALLSNCTTCNPENFWLPVSMLSLTIQFPVRSTASHCMVQPWRGIEIMSPGTRSSEQMSWYSEPKNLKPSILNSQLYFFTIKNKEKHKKSSSDLLHRALTQWWMILWCFLEFFASEWQNSEC